MILCPSSKSKGTSRSEKNYVMDSLRELGLEVYNQSYKLKSSYSIPKVKTEGENVYGILRTTKNPSVESMLMVVPLDETRLEGAALALTMADYFKDQVYWARDIIFLFVDPYPVAMEAWLSAFHGYTINNLIANPLPRRSGTITGVYIFDLAGTNFDYLDIKFFGVGFIWFQKDDMHFISGKWKATEFGSCECCKYYCIQLQNSH